MPRFVLLAILVLPRSYGVYCGDDAARGMCFPRQMYDPAPLPRYDLLRNSLLGPICDEHPLWVTWYWKAWEPAFRNFRDRAPGSGFVLQFIDASFNDNIFLWDTCLFERRN